MWGYDFDPGSNVVDVYVGYLRKKFGAGPISTVRGMGYRFNALTLKPASLARGWRSSSRLQGIGDLVRARAVRGVPLEAASTTLTTSRASGPAAPVRATATCGCRSARRSARRVALVEGPLAGDRVEERGAQPPHVAGGSGRAERPGSACSGAMYASVPITWVELAPPPHGAHHRQVDQARGRAHDDVARLDVEVHVATCRK